MECFQQIYGKITQLSRGDKGSSAEDGIVALKKALRRQIEGSDLIQIN